MKPSTELMMWGFNLIEKYGKEAHALLSQCWDRHIGFEGYGYIESCFAYALIREVRPRIILEASPACGMSTYPLALAVKRNKIGKVYSFEIRSDYVKKWIHNIISNNLAGYAEIFEGDVKETVKPVLKEVGHIDVLFMDCDHGGAMGKWYMDKLFPATRQWLHVHDFYYLPNDGEILVIKQFLEDHPDIKWLSTKHLFKADLTKHETHEEANSSIWIQAPELPLVAKKWSFLE